MDGRTWGAWRVVGCLLGWSGCLGYPDQPPPPLAETESSGAGVTTTNLGTAADANVESGATTKVDATTGVAETSTTGPIVECGNGDVEDGEDCDGTDWNGATCESLGFGVGVLMCVGCQFDVSRCGLTPGMVEVPGGVFEMGDPSHSPYEGPIRQVQVDTFWIDEMEVTVEAYAACVDAGTCSEPSEDQLCNWMVAGRDGHPVNCVTWYQAEEYCGWAGGAMKRLPTEAEWEKAARGTDAREYPWGDSPEPSCSNVVMDDDALGVGCGMGSTWEVGSKPLGDSFYGVHDMAGNVEEWVADWWWYQHPYDEAETDNPTGPAMGTLRVLRGGSYWSFNEGSFRVVHRWGQEPTENAHMRGFRCVKTWPPPAAPRIDQE